MNKLIDIQVRPRKAAIEFFSKTPWAAISVSTDPAKFPVLREENRVGLLQLSFWDICNPKFAGEFQTENIAEGMRDKVFTRQQADEILSFVSEMLSQIDTLLVHCEMGLSRSPAIAAAVANVLWGPGMDKIYFNRYTPNSFVYKMILESHYGVGSENADVPKTTTQEQFWNDNDSLD